MLGPILQWVNKIYQKVNDNLNAEVDVNVSTRASQSTADTIETKVDGQYDWGKTSVNHNYRYANHESREIVDVAGSGFLMFVFNHRNSAADITIEFDNNGYGINFKNVATEGNADNTIKDGFIPIFARFESRLKITASESVIGVQYVLE